MTIAHPSATSTPCNSGWTRYGGGYQVGASPKRVIDSQSVSTLAA